MTKKTIFVVKVTIKTFEIKFKSADLILHAFYLTLIIFLAWKLFVRLNYSCIYSNIRNIFKTLTNSPTVTKI